MRKEYVEDKSILTFLQCQSIIVNYVVAFRVLTKYISFVHVLVLIILDNFYHFAFWPIARLSIVPSLCGHFQTSYVCLSRCARVVNGLKLSCLFCLSRHFRVTDPCEILHWELQPVGLKIEIHKIHQNLRNPMCNINNKSTICNKIHLYEAKII